MIKQTPLSEKYICSHIDSGLASLSLLLNDYRYHYKITYTCKFENLSAWRDAAIIITSCAETAATRQRSAATLRLLLKDFEIL